MPKRFLSKTKLTVPSVKKHLTEVRKFVRQQLEDINLGNVDKSQIVLAIDEACANAMVHGNQGNKSKSIDIEMSVDTEHLEIKISDDGSNDFDIAKHLSKDIEELVKNKEKGGMGLKLMHSVMDEVRFIREKSKNVCYLRKVLQ